MTLTYRVRLPTIFSAEEQRAEAKGRAAPPKDACGRLAEVDTYAGAMKLPRLLTRHVGMRPPGLVDAASAVAEVEQSEDIRLALGAPIRRGAYSYFRYRTTDTDLFVKVCLKEVGDRERHERLAAQAAGIARCSPTYFPNRGQRTQVSAFVDLPQVTWEQTKLFGFRSDFAAKYRTLSGLLPDIPRPEQQNLASSSLLGWPRHQNKVSAGTKAQALSPSKVASMAQLLDWALEQLQKEPWSLSFCHFDLLRHNILYREDSGVVIIDFDKVGWAEQLRGYGQFYGYTSLPPEEFKSVLLLLFLREPSQAEVRRFSLWVAVHSIDHLWFEIYKKGQQEAVDRKTKHIVSIRSLLPDMPAAHIAPFVA